MFYGLALAALPVCGQNSHTTPADPAAVDAVPQYRFITTKQRFEHLAAKTVGPTALVQAVVSPAIQTWRRSPEEWPPTWRGFGTRAGYRYARVGVSNAIEMAVEMTVKEDPRFFRSRAEGFGPRLKHAVAWTFLAHKPDGSRSFAFGRFAGKLGSSFIANTWYPPSNDRWYDAVRRTGWSYGYGAAFNVLKEFVPDLGRPFKRNKK